jgi:hypothetical protein
MEKTLYSLLQTILLTVVSDEEQITVVVENSYCNSRVTRVYPKISGLAAWKENCKWYSSLQVVAVVSLLCESV